MDNKHLAAVGMDKRMRMGAVLEQVRIHTSSNYTFEVAETDEMDV